MKMTLKSLWRRKGTIIKIMIVAFFAVFFMTAVLLFQENMYSYQIKNSQGRFGNWFFLEKTSKDILTDKITDNPLIQDGYQSGVVAQLYDESYNKTDYRVGWYEDDFYDQSGISMYCGSLPQENNEIAVDMSTLTGLGYTCELGQTIKLYYLSGSGSTPTDANKSVKEYTLTGVMNTYTLYWNGGTNVAGAILTKDEANSYGKVDSYVNIYQLKNGVRTNNYQLVYNNMSQLTTSKTYYNSNVYEYKLWGSDLVYNIIFLIIMSIGVVAISYQLMSYELTRRSNYYKMRCIGADKWQIKRMVITECLIIILPASILGVLVAIAAADKDCNVIASKTLLESFFAINPSLLWKISIAIVITIALEEIFMQFSLFRKKLYGNTGRISEKGLQRISHIHSRLSGNNLARQFVLRYRKINIAPAIFIRFFVAAVTVIMLMCSVNVYRKYESYKTTKDLPDVI
jgi:ABC-type antimicrobial peptide transport system permease subunit